MTELVRFAIDQIDVVLCI